MTDQQPIIAIVALTINNGTPYLQLVQKVLVVKDLEDFNRQHAAFLGEALREGWQVVNAVVSWVTDENFAAYEEAKKTDD